MNNSKKITYINKFHMKKNLSIKNLGAKGKIGYIIICAILAAFSINSFIRDCILLLVKEEMCSQLRIRGIIWGVGYIGLVAYYMKFFMLFLESRKKQYAIFVGCIFSFFMVSANCFAESDGLSILLEQKSRYFFRYAGYAVFFSIIVFMIMNWLESSHCISNQENKENPFFRRHILGITFSFLMLCWCPYIIISYPGNLPYDPSGQLAGYLGYCELTNQHPPFSTWMIGILYKIGSSLKDDNLGVFFITVVQAVNLAISISFMIAYMCKKIRINNVFLGIMWLFFGIFYFWPSMSVYIVKDIFSLPFFIYFVISFVDAVYMKGNKETIRSIQIIIAGFGYSLFRHNGIYIVLICELCALFLVRKRKRSAINFICIIVVSLCLYNAFNTYAVDRMMPDNFKENNQLFKVAFSMPLQQTANYIVHYGDEVTIDEKEAISKIMNYDAVPELYNRELSDPIWTSLEAKKEDLKEYLKIWLQQFFKHPGCYMEAAVGLNYRYFYFDMVFSGQFDIVYGILQGYLSENHVLDIYFPDTLSNARKNLGIYNTWQRLNPFIYILTVCGTYTWGLMIFIAILIKHRLFRYIAGLLPFICITGICAISPLNGNMIYLLPVVVMFPFVIAFIFYALQDISETYLEK